MAGNAEMDDVEHDALGRFPPKHEFVVKGAKFRVHPRYSFVKALGAGAYGVVCAVSDSQTGKRAAVKKVAGLFEDLTDAKRILREIRLMRCMEHENILRIVDIDEPEHYDGFADVYIISELMSSDMGKLLRSSVPLLDNQKKYFMYQLLKALKYIHSANIFHRDIKPANILVSETCDIKLCDFGLARFVDMSVEEGKDMTEYVVTRWYRAPELLLAPEGYTAAIDMWSAGCFLAELYTRKPLFPGNDVKNQIEVICALIGKPTEEEMKQIRNPRARKFLSELKPRRRLDLATALPGACPQAIDLITKLLQFDPRVRLSADEALGHPYMAEYREPESEKTGLELEYDMLEPPNERQLGREGVRRLMWDEILKFHPGARNRETDAAHRAEKRVENIVARS